MNRSYCEREMEIIEALLCGALATELERHARSCAICRDTLAVSEFFQANKDTAPVLPDSDFLWWKGQLAGKQLAVERATRSIVLVRKAAYLGMTAAGLWLVLAPGPLRSIASALSKHDIWLAGGLRESVVFMGIGALVFTLLSSLYLARSEK